MGKLRDSARTKMSKFSGFVILLFVIQGSLARASEEHSTTPGAPAQSGLDAPPINEEEYKTESHSVIKNSSQRYQLVSFNFHHVQVPYVICLWILLASIAKIGFHLYDKLPHIFPESCLLITLGILVGVTLYYTETAQSNQYTLDADTFFIFLLPPIIYDAGYHMPNRAFFNNLGTILLLAVVNTLWNTVGIGVGLWGMSQLGWIHQNISILHCFVFSALISAVDPVAVLAIFEEIQVNEILYIIVFGESLLNDGVTVVLYRMMEGFTEIGESNLQTIDFVMGFCQFFIVVIGGTTIGVVYGLIGAFITKYTDHVRVIEPLFIFVLGYLAYLTAETMELSGILALTFGGIIMRHYTEANMTKKSTTTVKYFMKMLANISETIIFMFLGLSTVTENHNWQLDFILFTILFCLIFRVTGVIFLSYVANRRRLIRLTAIDQFIMSYGGLRGGIAFCLALLLNQHHIPEKDMFVSTTVVMVFFTVFVQGITIKPVVNALKVEKNEEIDPSMNEMIHRRFIDHLMAGIEDIVGRSGHNSLHHKFEYYNTKYLKPWLLREKPKSRDTAIMRVFTKLNLQEAKATAKSFTSGMSRDPSFSNLIPPSPSMVSLYNRRATLATIPIYNGGDDTTVLNMPEHGYMKSASPEDEVFHQVLENSMFPPRNTWAQEHRHTLAEVHNHPPFHHSERKHLRHLMSELRPVGQTDGVTNAIYANGDVVGPMTGPGRKIRKNVSFTNGHSRLSKQLSDVAEISPAQEAVNQPQEAQAKVVFTVGMPAPSSPTGTPETPQTPDDSNSDPPAPPMDPEAKPPNSTDPPSSSKPEDSNPQSPARESSTTVASSTSAATELNTPPPSSSEAAASRPQSIPLSTFKVSPSISIPSNSKSNHSKQGQRKRREEEDKEEKEEEKEEDEEKEEEEEEEGEEDDESKTEEEKDDDKDELMSPKEETIAESSLPWRRQTSLPPVSSSVSLSLPDDENPLMSEVPSWAHNLAYHNLTETGSPYHSPYNTITAEKTEPNPRPIFDIFPPSSPTHHGTHHESHHIPIIPPPWSSSPDITIQESEPLPSHASQNSLVGGGDKASSMLVSAHDLAPPVHHSCIQPKAHSIDGGNMRRVFSASSPIHFQHMEKPDTMTEDSVESYILGIEADYHHSMTDRVSRWLASSHSDVSNEEDKERILESLREKKQKWQLGDTDDGTDADVESDSDDGVEDTKL